MQGELQDLKDAVCLLRTQVAHIPQIRRGLEEMKEAVSRLLGLVHQADEIPKLRKKIDVLEEAVSYQVFGL